MRRCVPNSPDEHTPPARPFPRRHLPGPALRRTQIKEETLQLWTFSWVRPNPAVKSQLRRKAVSSKAGAIRFRERSQIPVRRAHSTLLRGDRRRVPKVGKNLGNPKKNRERRASAVNGHRPDLASYGVIHIRRAASRVEGWSSGCSTLTLGWNYRNVVKGHFVCLSFERIRGQPLQTLVGCICVLRIGIKYRGRRLC